MFLEDFVPVYVNVCDNRNKTKVKARKRIIK